MGHNGVNGPQNLIPYPIKNMIYSKVLEGAVCHIAAQLRSDAGGTRNGSRGKKNSSAGRHGVVLYLNLRNQKKAADCPRVGAQGGVKNSMDGPVLREDVETRRFHEPKPFGGR